MQAIPRLAVALLAIIFINMPALAQQTAKKIPYPASPEGIIGFLEFKPANYGSQRHPLIIFLHGREERGDGSSQIQLLIANGIPRYCAAGASMKFTYKGQSSSFVVLSPQLSRQYGAWQTGYVKEMIRYAKNNLIIDTNRIYITGLSLGGGGVWNAITESFELANNIAAAAPVCGTQEMNDGNFCKTIGAAHLPVWAFHAMDDKTVGVQATQHGEILGNICKIIPAEKITYYQSGGHPGAWLNAYDTGHITAEPNLYEWFLGNTREASGKNAETPRTTGKEIQAAAQGLVNKKRSGGGLGGWFKKEKDCFNMFSKAAIIPYTTYRQ